MYENFLKPKGQNKMLLAIDIGNTNVTMGVYNSNNLLFTARLSTDSTRTADQYAIDIKDVLSLHNQNLKEIDSCIIASVVPSVCSAVKQGIKLFCGVEAVVLGPGVKTGLNIKIDNPAQLGADLAAGAVGALGKYSLPCIIIDMGTATTVSVLDKDGSFMGGVITAGVKLTLKALTQNTAQLPSIDIQAPSSVIGTNTTDCMRSGLIFGSAAMLDGIIQRIEQHLGEEASVVATGGLSGEIIKHCCRKDIVYDENLLLDGLLKIYEKNK